MSDVTGSTLYQQTTKEIVDYLRTNLDSASFTASTQVYASFPSKRVVFPTVVVTPPNVDGERGGFTGLTKRVDLTVDVFIYAKNAKTVDVIGDDVVETLTGSTGTVAFSDKRIHNRGIRGTRQRKFGYGNLLLYEKRISIPYEFWGG